MAEVIQLRRDLAANWTTANPTLAQGELGIETDTKKIKLGDGTTAWGSLGYWALGALLAANNLSDLLNATTGRFNLAVPELTAAKCVSVSNVSALSGLGTFDGYTLANGDIVLLVGQTTASQNGPWQTPATGNGAWARPLDFPSGGSVGAGRVCHVEFGTSYAGSGWVLQTPTAGLTIDTTAQVWVRTSATGGGGGGGGLTGNTPATISANTFSLSGSYNLYYYTVAHGFTTAITTRPPSTSSDLLILNLSQDSTGGNAYSVLNPGGGAIGYANGIIPQSSTAPNVADLWICVPNVALNGWVALGGRQAAGVNALGTVGSGAQSLVAGYSIVTATLTASTVTPFTLPHAEGGELLLVDLSNSSGTFSAPTISAKSGDTLTWERTMQWATGAGAENAVLLFATAPGNWKAFPLSTAENYSATLSTNTAVTVPNGYKQVFYTLGANNTPFTLPSPNGAGDGFWLTVSQGATGGFSYTIAAKSGAALTWDSNQSPVISTGANEEDTYYFQSPDGTNWEGFPSAATLQGLAPIVEYVYTNATASGTLTLQDPATTGYTVQRYVVGNGATVTFANCAAAAGKRIVVQIETGTSPTINFPTTNTQWAGPITGAGSAPTVPASSTTRYSVSCIDGTHWVWAFVGRSV